MYRSLYRDLQTHLYVLLSPRCIDHSIGTYRKVDYYDVEQLWHLIKLNSSIDKDDAHEASPHSQDNKHHWNQKELVVHTLESLVISFRMEVRARLSQLYVNKCEHTLKPSMVLG